MGELRQRGNIWWVRYYRNGRRYEESSGSTKKEVAKRLLQLREGDVAKGIPITPQVGRTRFDEAVADVVTDYRVNGKKSLDHVARRIRLHLEPHFRGRRMAGITTADVRGYIEARQTAGASNAEINRELAVLKRAFTLAVQAGKLLARPHIPMLEERNVRTGFFERAEFEDVRSHLPVDIRSVVTFAYATGWRIPSEVLPLKWSQVDRATKTIRLEPGTTKNLEGRTFPYGMLPELEDAIERQWRAHKRLSKLGMLSPYVFHRNGKPIAGFRKAWRSACSDAGVSGRIPHDFRRTAIRNLVRAGVPERTAMQLTGHRTRSVFDRYDIVSEADLRDAVGRLARETGTERGQIARSGRVARFGRSRK